MAARLLSPAELITRCDAASLGLDDTGAPQDAPAPADAPHAIVGQERARAAVEYGIAMPRPGHHLFVMGPPGSGKKTLVRQAIAKHLERHAVQRFDWVYVNNFAQPHRPLALQLPPGRGAKLREHMRELVDDLGTTLPATFESEEYVNAVARLNTDFKERAEAAVLAVGEAAQREGLAMVRTPMGLSFAPRKGESEVMPPQEFEALPIEERERLKRAMNHAQDELLLVLRKSVRLRKEHADRLRTLNRSMSEFAVQHAVDAAKQHYADLAAVLEYLDAVRTDVITKADTLRASDEEGNPTPEAPDLTSYEVNVLVDLARDGSPIVSADHPTHSNLMGRVDHVARMGTLLTDYRLIKAGVLHRANGGYLLIDAMKLLAQPFAWDALKRALLRAQIRIEGLAEAFSLISTVQLEPAPIPLTVKVVLFGERDVVHLLQAYDPEFNQLFRVIADLGDELPREAGTQRELALALAARSREQALLAASSDAMARLLEYGSRRAGDATHLSASVQHLLDVLLEADHIARNAARQRIDDTDVSSAIAARRNRSSRVHDKLQQEVVRGHLMIDTSGERIGQVNGLMVYEVGDQMFGEPVRISATTRLGEGEVIDIQRETHLGGPLHAKGVLILGAFLAARYSRLHAHAIQASLVFEQSYGLIEGDSASLAELVALLSSIGDIPVKQSFAITGSVNQFGDAQPIGGVNEKIEGFFDLCVVRGLDGSHGVIVPHTNVAQLMLRDDVIAACAAGRFAIHSVRNADEAMEMLTGLPAGQALAPQRDSINGRIAARLREYAALQRGKRQFSKRRGNTPAAQGDGEEE